MATFDETLYRSVIEAWNGHREGVTTDTVADSIGVDTETVKKIVGECRRNGVTMKDRRGKKTDSIKKAFFAQLRDELAWPYISTMTISP